MTLLINEIHLYQNLHTGYIIQAADQRITLRGKFLGNHQKLFRIPYLNAGVGYFGLAVVDQAQKHFLSSYLPNFINHSADVTTPQAFAERLQIALNRDVDKNLLRSNSSGFHICGYNSQSLPEMWYVQNIGRMEGPIYKDFQSTYSISDEFLPVWRDRVLDPDKTYCQYYINGDVRAFHAVWQRLDSFIGEMLTNSDFKSPKQPEDLVVITKWKMKVIADFYRQFAKHQIIGTPIDSFILFPQGGG
jgi:hypothetical protein